MHNPVIKELDEAIERSRQLAEDLEDLEAELDIKPDDWRLSLSDAEAAEVHK